MSEIQRRRGTPGAAAVFVVTLDCPVGCAHCSVAAEPARSGGMSGRAADADLQRTLTGLAAIPPPFLVALTGGEPVAARRVLEQAVERLGAAGHDLVLYTSGMWGVPGRGPAPWLGALLGAVDTVVFGVDRFHLQRVGREQLVDAVRAAAAAGCWVILQSLADEPPAVATTIAQTALGPDHPDRCEIHRAPLLATGRAAGLRTSRGRDGTWSRDAERTAEVGACGLLGTPAVLADGAVTACCNEDVITGHGPTRLHRPATFPGGLSASLADIAGDPELAVIARLGPDALWAAGRPPERDPRPAAEICGRCWSALERSTPARRMAMAHVVPASRPTGGGV